MIAFHIFGRPIYWYGIFYLMTFLGGYVCLWWLGRSGVFSHYTGLQRLLTDKRDDLMLVAMLGVILWGRFGHVVLYELGYYLEHPLQILQVRQGGMSFIGGVMWVVLWLLILARSLRLTKDELFLLGDIVLCIVPLWSLLWRWGNYLNQELRWIPEQQLEPMCAKHVQQLGLARVYDTVDSQLRVNTNLIQWLGEWLLLLVVNRSIMLGRYMRAKIQPWMITGVFFIGYGVVRFFAEYMKELPAYEYRGILSKSQRVMLLFVMTWVWFLYQAIRRPAG